MEEIAKQAELSIYGAKVLLESSLTIGTILLKDEKFFLAKAGWFLINDDMAITFSIITSGKRVIYDIEAITEEDASINLKDDYNVKNMGSY
jgi:hypothetical protein